MNLKSKRKIIVNIVGARPQFIKASIVLKRLSDHDIDQLLIHTGQHYDFNMSDFFFKELNIKEPDYYLGIGSGKHGKQTGKMLEQIEKVLLQTNTSLVIVYGDTNTTLAGALAASKIGIPVAHVEAGLRSYNKEMPEEINRILTDHVSDLLFAPTYTAIENLKKESIIKNVFNVGDVMYDMALEFRKGAENRYKKVLGKYKLKSKDFILVTIHRAENTDNKMNILNIFESLKYIADKGIKVFFPVHPRTEKYMIMYKLLNKAISKNLIISEPIPYSDMLKS